MEFHTTLHRCFKINIDNEDNSIVSTVFCVWIPQNMSIKELDRYFERLNENILKA